MTDINYHSPSNAEIQAIVRQAHVMRAEMLSGFFAKLGHGVKSALHSLGFFKPNLVKTYLEA